MTADKHTTNTPSAHTEINMEQIAYSIRVTREALDHGADELSYDITERLRAARVRALAQAKQSPVIAVETAKTSALGDLFSWKHKMTAWIKGGIAVSAFTLALMISVVSIRSELTTDVAVSDRAISMAEPTTTEATNHTAGQGTASEQLSADNASALLGKASSTPQHRHGHSSTTTQEFGGNTSALSKNNASTATVAAAQATNPSPAVMRTAPVTTASSTDYPAISVDDEIGIVLHEQIPLQAYLNDDFARYANHQGLDTIEKNSSQNSSNVTTPTQ